MKATDLIKYEKTYVRIEDVYGNRYPAWVESVTAEEGEESKCVMTIRTPTNSGMSINLYAHEIVSIRNISAPGKPFERA